MRRVALLLWLTACGRIGFDGAAPADDADACVGGAACAPASAVCWTGVVVCADDACALDQPLDQGACPGGACTQGVCSGPAGAPLIHAAAGGDAYFGASVATDGLRLVVGAPRANAAYVLERAPPGWAVTATLTSTWGPANSLFGSAVAIDGDRIVVGSRYSRGAGMAPASNAGAIVIYERAPATGIWSETAQVLGPDGGEFGNSLSLRGDRVLVGAEYANTITGGWGTAYVVEKQGATWIPVATLAAVGGDRLGHHVVLDGERAFAGSLWDPGPVSSETGAIRAWERQANGTWALSATLQPDDLRPDALGQFFSVSGTTLVAGVPWFSDGDRGTGAVYVYTRAIDGTWATPGPLLPPVAQRDFNFGRGVVVHGDRLFATSTDWTSTPPGATTLHAYRRQADGGWLEVARRIDADGIDHGYGLGGIEVDLQTTMIDDEVVVGFPIRNYASGMAPGAIVIHDVAGL